MVCEHSKFWHIIRRSHSWTSNQFWRVSYIRNAKIDKFTYIEYIVKQALTQTILVIIYWNAPAKNKKGLFLPPPASPSPHYQCCLMGKILGDTEPTLTVGGGGFQFAIRRSKYYDQDCLCQGAFCYIFYISENLIFDIRDGCNTSKLATG